MLCPQLLTFVVGLRGDNAAEYPITIAMHLINLEV
jgi:hypothetical protein